MLESEIHAALESDTTVSKKRKNKKTKQKNQVHTLLGREMMCGPPKGRYTCQVSNHFLHCEILGYACHRMKQNDARLVPTKGMF